MTERVRRPAVWMLTWLVATASATAMAWWAVTFVTIEVADRRPLRPSDVVAASVLPAVAVPPWAGGSPVVGPPAGGAAVLELPGDEAGAVGAVRAVGAPSPPSPNDGGAATSPQTISTPVAAANPSPLASPARLIARWSATANASQGPTPSVAVATSEVVVALSPQAPTAPPAPPAPATGVTASPGPVASPDTVAAPRVASSTPSPSSRWPSRAHSTMAGVVPAPTPRPRGDCGHQPADLTASYPPSTARRTVARTHDPSWLSAVQAASAPAPAPENTAAAQV